MKNVNKRAVRLFALSVIAIFTGIISNFANAQSVPTADYVVDPNDSYSVSISVEKGSTTVVLFTGVKIYSEGDLNFVAYDRDAPYDVMTDVTGSYIETSDGIYVTVNVDANARYSRSQFNFSTLKLQGSGNYGLTVFVDVLPHVDYTINNTTTSLNVELEAGTTIGIKIPEAHWDTKTQSPIPAYNSNSSLVNSISTSYYVYGSGPYANLYLLISANQTTTPGSYNTNIPYLSKWDDKITLAVNITTTPSTSTAIKDVVSSDLLETSYYDINGRKAAQPKGLTIVKKVYSNGTTTTEKKLF